MSNTFYMSKQIIAYDKWKKGSGKPILLNGQYTNQVKGFGDLTMSFDSSHKANFKKVCVLFVENFQVKEFNSNRQEDLRAWFCYGNFTEFNTRKGQKIKNPNYDPLKPIVTSNASGLNRKHEKTIILKNVHFEIKFNNAVNHKGKKATKEITSGATTILRIFNHA